MDIRKESIKRVSRYCEVLVPNIESVGDAAMAKRLLSAEDWERLLQNMNVLKVSETTITYSPEFKIESFFGHMKDEIDLTSCYSIDQVRNAVAEYINDYNHHRYQRARKKMAPTEYRNHLLAAQ